MDTYNSEMTEAEEKEDRFLTFDLGSERYGIIINQVTEIIGLQTINKLPDMPDYIKGIINLRGTIIPVIDMGIKFRKQKRDYTDRTCIIVVETQELTAGLIVDNVAEVMQIKDIAPPPGLTASSGAKYINGVGKINGDVVVLIDCEQLFNNQEALLIKASESM